MMRVSGLPLLLTCLAAGPGAAVLMGQDANWDLLNYHLYNGVSLLRGWFGRDLLAAGMQTSLNPLLDGLYAWLALGPLQTAPRLLAAAMGLWAGLAAYFAARTALLLHEGMIAPAVAGAALGLTGSAFVSQIGTTTGEVAVAAFMLAGLFLTLRGSSPAYAGILFGIAAGLKLTAAAYAPAACLAAAAMAPRGSGRAAALFSASWAAGLAATDGWNALRLYERFGSPTFPMFNGVFRSPWYPPASLIDSRFIPHGVVQWLFYPMYWAVGAASPNDSPLRDPRAALALCLALAAATAWLIGRGARQRLSTPQRAALIFLSAGYATWLTTSSILRYAVVLEVAAGLVAPLLLARLGGGRAPLVAAVVLTMALTRYPSIERVPYGAQALRADMDWVEPGTLIVLTFRAPASYVAALMPERDGVSVVNVTDTALEARGWPLHDEIVRRIREHSGRIVVVTAGSTLGRFPELGEVGISPALTGCRAIDSTFARPSEDGLHACDATRADPPRLTSPFWAEAAKRYRTLEQPVDAEQSLAGAAYLRAAGQAARGTRFIDWTDLLWGGVGSTHDTLPDSPDPGTLYVLASGYMLGMAARIDPEVDLLGRVDGLVVAAPGRRGCSDCVESLDVAGFAPALGVGGGVSGAAALAYAGSGWWPAEATGAWSREEAELAIPLAADLPPLSTLVLGGRAFSGPGLTAQRVTAAASGPLAPQVVEGGAIRLAVRRDVLHRFPDGGFVLRVRLRFPDAASPAALGIGSDIRRLGFWLSSVSLEAAGAQ